MANYFSCNQSEMDRLRCDFNYSLTHRWWNLAGAMRRLCHEYAQGAKLTAIAETFHHQSRNGLHRNGESSRNLHFRKRAMPTRLYRTILLSLAGIVSWLTVQATPIIVPVGRQIEVLPPGEDFIWRIRSDNAKTSIKWWIRGWNGESLTQPASLPHGKEEQIRYSPTRLGWQELVVDIRNDSGTLVSEIRRGFVSGQARKLRSEDFKFGISSHLLRESGQLASGIDLIDKLGVAYVRDEIGWETVEPRAGVWDWTGTDAMVDALAKHNLQLNATLDYTVEWASTKPGNASIGILSPTERSKLATRVMPQTDPWLTYVRNSVSRYKSHVKYWEIWNEPDNGFWQSSPADYASLFSQTAKAIKQTDAEAVVLNGGFCMVPLAPTPTFLQDYMPLADRTNWDVFVYHDYSTFPQQLSNTKRVNDLIAKYKMTQSLWMNEGGRRSLGAESEREQAVTLTKRLATAPSLDVQAYFIYELQDGPNPNASGEIYGLMHHDYTAKPSFAAYQTLIQILGGRRYLKTEHTAEQDGGAIWEQVYAGRVVGENPIAAIWAEHPGQSTLLWFEGLDDARVFDMMGNPLAQPKSGVVPVGAEPIYLSRKEGGNWQPKRIATSPALIALVPGKTNKTSMTFTNPLNHSVKVTVETAEVTAGIHPYKSSTIEIAAGASANIPLELPCDKTVASPASATFADTISDIRLPLEIVEQVQKISMVRRPAELVSDEEKLPLLRGATSIVNLSPGETSDEVRWRGPTDLSAQARIGYDERALYLTVNTKDDIHSQKYNGAQLWHGDSLQFDFQPDARTGAALRIIVALGDSGTVTGWVFATPEGSSLYRGPLDLNRLPVLIYREKTSTLYALTIPWQSVGLYGPPAEAFGLTFLINDNDGKERKQWLQTPTNLLSIEKIDPIPSSVVKLDRDIYP